MLKTMSVRSQLLAALAGVMVLLAIFTVIVATSMNSISNAAQGMGQGKDVVADILPPPLYVLEAELAVYELHEAPPAELPRLQEKLVQLKKDYDERNAFWTGEGLDAGVKSALLGEQKRQADEFWKLLLGDYLAAVKAQDAARIVQLKDELRKRYLAHRDGVDATVKLASAYADGTATSLQQTSASLRWLVFLLAGGGALLAALFMLAIIREILNRLGGEPLEMQAVASRIADGDLVTPMTVGAGDSTSLAASIGLMQANLRNTIQHSREASSQVADAARGLATSAEQVSASSLHQSEAAAVMASSIEEVTASVEAIAASAAGARVLAEETGKLSHAGKIQVDETVAGIHAIAASVSRAGEVIQTLGEQSSQISNIVNVIREIADQTNLLALNAAIEAARAGEQGRGFAVVADEVRKLAERTSSSTQEIATMIEAIQRGTQSAVQEMAAGSAQVDEGVEKAAQTGESMLRIEQSIGEVLTAVQDISNSLREQSGSSAQIAHGIEQIAQMTEENGAATEEVSAAAHQLQGLAATLQDNVSRFRV